MQIEVSNGEILDKYSILILKLDQTDDPAKLLHIKTELQSIQPAANKIFGDKQQDLMAVFDGLHEINMELWDILQEQHEQLESNDPEAARLTEIMLQIYDLNNHRYTAKRLINKLTNSHLQEEKCYHDKA